MVCSPMQVRKGGVTVQLSPTEALLLKDIVQSSQSEPDPGGGKPLLALY